MAASTMAPTEEKVAWLIAAKMMVSKAFPYLNTALYSARFRPTELKDSAGNPTMGMDGRWNLYVDPGCEHRWTVREGAMIIVHELWHALREHNARINERSDHRTWNIAADCEINRGHLPYDLEWPKDGVTWEKLGLPEEGLTEEYYDLLKTKSRKNCPQHGGQQGQQGQGKGQNQSEGQGEGNEPGQGKGDCTCGEDELTNDVSNGGCGSVAHDKPLDHEDGPGEGSKEQQQERTRRIAYDVAKRIQMEQKNPSSQRGDVPAGFARWAETIIAGPQVDWRVALRSKVTRAVAYRSGFGRPTYTRRSRRQQAVPHIILPGNRKPVIRVGVQIDTSGSMCEAEIAAIINEIRGILNCGDTQGLYVMCVDAAVHWEGEITSPTQLELRGGGGTDMGVGIIHAETVTPKLNVLVVATDTETPWPPSPPDNISVVVVSTRENGHGPGWLKPEDYLYIDPKKLVGTK